jgi:hypothetical protein
MAWENACSSKLPYTDLQTAIAAGASDRFRPGQEQDRWTGIRVYRTTLAVMRRPSQPRGTVVIYGVSFNLLRRLLSQS